MDDDLRHGMFRYYDERASEYEEAYVLGTGTASISDPGVFQREAALLTGVIERFARGRIIDIAGGSGYWLPYYAAGCSSITVIDQSLRMLDEYRKKVVALNATDRTTIVQDDVFEHAFAERAYDSALVGFLISHLTGPQEEMLFERLRGMLDTGGRFLILESAWSSERARFNTKSERQERHLNDGTRFEIYKRYIDQQDAADWATKYRANIAIEYFGTAFVAVSGMFEG